MRMGDKIHLGAGKHHIRGFVNVDPFIPHSHAGFDVQADALNYMKKVPGDTVVEIISRHMIEHIHKQRAPRLMNNCFRAMKNGGKITIECPDLLASCRRFVDSEGKAEPGGIFGKHRYGGDTHLWGYSQHTLRKLVEDAGFVVTHLGPGRDRHASKEQPCILLTAVKP